MNVSVWLALGAIGLWASLAALGVALAHVPPLLLTGLALVIGSVVALPLSRFDLRAWRVPLPTLALGVYGLFGYHFVLFMALRFAPPVQANLVNYLWPLLIVVMAPLFLRGVTLRAVHVVSALVGFAGAALVILGGKGSATAAAPQAALGYALAGAAAFMWASYSLLTKRVAAFPTAAIGSFALTSGALALVCHALLEPRTALSGQDWALIVAIGLGPMGAAFFLWDAALKRGDARSIGILSFITPLASTCVLLAMQRSWPQPVVLAAGAMIIGAAVVGTRTK
jgi:drug/metabolite transporter (DMT)-like permease